VYTSIALLFLSIIGFLLDYAQIVNDEASLSNPTVTYLPFLYRVDGSIPSGRPIQGVQSISFGEVMLLFLALFNLYYYIQDRQDIRVSKRRQGFNQLDPHTPKDPRPSAPPQTISDERTSSQEKEQQEE
jgi:hypothetical protein